MEVAILPLNLVLDLPPGTNLLEALRAHQVPISYSCMAGRCGTCRCKVVEGEVMDVGSGQRRPLAGGEQTVLACQTSLTGPCTVEVTEPDEVRVHPARLLKATVVANEALTHDIRRLLLRPAKPLAFSPGQYVQLQITPGHIRPYSMAGLARDELLEFHVRLLPNGHVTSYIANTLALGDAVRVSGPLGSAYLRCKHTWPILCVAGGTGLAPILSIVRGTLEAGMGNPVHLYFGVRTPADLYGLDWLAHLQRDHPSFTVHPVIASGGGGAGTRAGLVTDAIASDLGDLSGWRAHLCGSPTMVEAASQLVQSLSLRPDHLYADAFHASPT